MLVILREWNRSVHALLYGMGEDLPGTCQRATMESPYWFMSGIFLTLDAQEQQLFFVCREIQTTGEDVK